MYFRISDDIGLRSWPDLGFAFYRKGRRTAEPLSDKMADILLLCDGEHDIEMDPAVMLLCFDQLIAPCEKGEHPSAWSAYRKYENKYVPFMNLMITGKCNYNCLHCFNAADNAALMTEWSFEEICDLLDQARDCGIASFTITGGEPMMHRRFPDILREIYRRDMTVFALNTNGYYITGDLLDEMKDMGCLPAIKISFDGVGTHDWMRGRKGAEKIALNAVKLCAEKGFEVLANTQVHRGNVHTMLPTARLLNDLGVGQMRIIRTTEVPRWAKNAPDMSLSLEEYYDQMLSFLREYIETGMDMRVYVWQFAEVNPKEHSFSLKPVKCADGQYSDSCPCCESTRSMVGITSDGEAVPCLQMSGYFTKYGISLGNVRKTPLRDILNSGKYMDLAAMKVGDVRAQTEKCAQCPFFRYCGGGCRALGMLYAEGEDDFLREDVTKCCFFENGWYQKVTRALAGWKNQREITREIILP